VADQGALLLGFARRAVEHSALAGDGLGALLRAACDHVAAGTGAAPIGYVEAEAVGEDVLLRHEVELDRALVAADLQPVAADGRDTFPVIGVDSELFSLVVAVADADARAFVQAIVEVLTATLHRHWREVQHIQRAHALREAQQHTHVGCFEWDIVTDKVRWSDELFRIYGYAPQSFEPSFEEFLERIHPDDREAIRASVFQAYEERRDYRIEERIVRPDGAVRLLSSWGHMITNDAGEPVKIIGSCQDVTEIRATMAELAATASRLAEVDGRRAQALEINDNVVQGLAAASYALDAGLHDDATTAIAGTLAAARTMIGDLIAAGGGDVAEGGLGREEVVPTFLVPNQPRSSRRSNGSARVIRVVLADDSSDIRLLVAFHLRAADGFEIVAEASHGLEAIARVDQYQPDVILLDLAMPSLDGLEAIPRIREASPGTKVIVLSGFDARTGAAKAFERGAVAYVEKGVVGRSLPDVLRAVCAGSPDAAPIVVSASTVATPQ
jgi:PAS domain S-box-containing protein